MLAMHNNYEKFFVRHVMQKLKFSVYVYGAGKGRGASINGIEEYPWPCLGEQFLWNFFISKEAVAAERRYEKERRSVMVNACKLHLEQGCICSLFSLPFPPPPSHPPPINVIRVASCVYFLSPPPHPRIPHC
jgi:hypothetical protein